MTMETTTEHGDKGNAGTIVRFLTGEQNAPTVFAFYGYFTAGVMRGIGDAFRRRLATEGLRSGDINKVFSVFIELSENITRYSDDFIVDDQGGAEITDPYLRKGCIVVSENGPGIVVSAHNLVRNEKVEKLQVQLGGLQEMDQAGLKKLYRERLREGPPDGSRGAGLGFIECARRSTRPLDFAFEPADDELSHFYITIWM